MLSSRFSQNLVNSSKARYKHINELTGGVLDICVRAARNFNDRNAFDAAAAIAFYALFSLFPLLLLLIVIGSFWLESEAVQFQLLRLVAYALPGSLDYLAKVIDEVLALQRTASLIGIIGLVWSATGVFHSLAYNISAAWQPHKARGFFAGRFIALITVVLSLPASYGFTQVLSEVADNDIIFKYTPTGALWWLAIITVLAVIASGFPARRATQVSVRESLAYQ